MALSLSTAAQAPLPAQRVAKLAPAGHESADAPGNKGFDHLLQGDRGKVVSRRGGHPAKAGDVNDGDKPLPGASEDPADPVSQEDQEPAAMDSQDQAAKAGKELSPGGTDLPPAIVSPVNPPILVEGGNQPSTGQVASATQAGAPATNPSSTPANPLPAALTQAGLAEGSEGSTAKTELTSAHAAESSAGGAERHHLARVAGLEGQQGPRAMDAVPVPAVPTATARTDAALAANAQSGPGQSHPLPGGALDMGHGAQESAPRQLGERLLWMVGNDVQSARVRITPPHLGSLELQLSLQHNQASVTLLAHNAALRDLVQAAIPRLAEQFAANGLVLADAQVAADPRGQGGAGSAGNGGEGRTGSRELAVSPASGSTPGEGEIAVGAMRLPAHAGVLSTFV